MIDNPDDWFNDIYKPALSGTSLQFNPDAAHYPKQRSIFRSALEFWLIILITTLTTCGLFVLGYAVRHQTQVNNRQQVQITQLNHACIPTETGGGVTQCIQPNGAR